MITIFDRKELTVTRSMEEQARIRDILATHQIDYQVKTVDRSSPTSFSAGTRARIGSCGERAELAHEYAIYVKKKDLEKAAYLIRK